jgi:hypothetical protein
VRSVRRQTRSALPHFGTRGAIEPRGNCDRHATSAIAARGETRRRLQIAGRARDIVNTRRKILAWQEVSMRIRSLGLVMAAAVIAVSLSACSTSPTTVSSIAVTGTVPAIGASSQFSAVATFSGGTTQDVTSTATWVSSNTGVATVSATGMVTAVAAGNATISATYQAVAGSDAITLNPS